MAGNSTTSACSTCGAEIGPGESVCSRCGTPVLSAEPATQAAADPNLATGPNSSGALLSGSSAGPVVGRADPQSPAPATGPPADFHSVARGGSTGATMARSAPGGEASHGPDDVTVVTSPAQLEYVRDQIESHLRHGYIHLRRKNYAAAKEEAGQVLQLSNGDPDGHELMGLALEAEGDEVGAFRAYREACKGEPKPAEAERRMAGLVLRLPSTVVISSRTSTGASDLPPEAEAKLPAEVRVALSQPPPPPPKQRATVPALASMAVPGLGQAMLGRYGRGAAMALIWICCVLFVLKVAVPGHGASGSGIPGASAGLITDPILWGAVFVLLIDYVWSIMDASSQSSSF